MRIARTLTPHHGFLVERYLPASAAPGLALSVAAVAQVCDRSVVVYLQSMYVPSEDTCFCLFLADSMQTVRDVNAAGEFRLDRITPAVVLLFPSIATYQEGPS